MEVAPERVLQQLLVGGATLVSINPLRETLEDFFVRQVEAAGPAPSRAV